MAEGGAYIKPEHKGTFEGVGNVLYLTGGAGGQTDV